MRSANGSSSIKYEGGGEARGEVIDGVVCIIPESPLPRAPKEFRSTPFGAALVRALDRGKVGDVGDVTGD